MSEEVKQPFPKKRSLVERRLGDLLKELQPLEADADPGLAPREQDAPGDPPAPEVNTAPGLEAATAWPAALEEAAQAESPLAELTSEQEQWSEGESTGLVDLGKDEWSLEEEGSLPAVEAPIPLVEAVSADQPGPVPGETLQADEPEPGWQDPAVAPVMAAGLAAAPELTEKPLQAQPRKAEKSRPGFANKAWGDFVLLGGVSLLLLVLIFLSYRPLALASPLPELLQGLRVILGVFYLLFVPGYFLTATLFPRREDLDGLERVGLSLGMSVVIIPILALILNQLPYGLTFQSVVWASLGGSLLLLLLALIQRWRLPAEVVAPSFGRLGPRGWWRQLPRSDRASYLVVIPILIFTIAAAAWAVTSSAEPPATSEFYILGEEDLAQDYPRQGAVGQPQQVTIGINNLEGQDKAYWVAAYQDQELIGTAGPFSIKDSQKLSAPLSYTPVQAGENVRIEFLLYQDLDESPYRRLELWMAVSPP